MSISYKLREVTAPRPLQVSIYDLGGRPVAQLPALEARSGIFSQEWDGLDSGGDLVGREIPGGSGIGAAWFGSVAGCRRIG